MLTALAANIYLLYLLTEREVLVKYRTNVFSTDRASAASQGSYRKTEVGYFTSTDRTSEHFSIPEFLYLNFYNTCEKSILYFLIILRTMVRTF